MKEEDYKCPYCGSCDWEERWYVFSYAPATIKTSDNDSLIAESNYSSTEVVWDRSKHKHYACAVCGHVIKNVVVHKRG